MPADTPLSYRLAEGAFLGSCRVVRGLAVDADGELYLGKHSTRMNAVLLRVFTPSATATAADREALAARCERAAAMQHPGLARSTPLQHDRDLAFTATDLPDGPRGEPMTLAAALAESGRRLPEERVSILAEALCQALAYAHRFRGDGLPHGHLSLETVYLTAQRQPRLVDIRLTGTAQPRDDLRAMGRLIARLLTGATPEPARTPCAPGLNRRWDRLVKACLTAGAADGFSSIDDLAQALAHPAGGRPARALAAAAVVVLAAALVTSLLLLARYRAGHHPDAVAPTAASTTPPAAGTAADDPRIDAWGRQADDCLARQDLDGAVAALTAWAEAVPADLQVRQRLASLQTRRGMALVEAVRPAAEAAFAQIAERRDTEALTERLEALKALRQEAAGHLASLRFPEAADAYSRLRNAAESLLSTAQGQSGATRARAAAESAREAAQQAAAEKDATEAWQAAENTWNQGIAAAKALEFGPAETAFNQAAKAFSLAAEQAAAARRLQAARDRLTDEKARAGEALWRRLPEDVRQRLDAATRAAAATAATGDLAGAAAALEATEADLARALDRLAAGGAATPPTARQQFHRPASGNLVTNGDLEAGQDDQPKAWSRTDGLTVFWDRQGGRPGRCLRFDTDVQQADKKQLQNQPEAFAGKTEGGQYNTVGAHEGVWAFAAPIPILPDDQYFMIEVDCMGPAKSSALMYPQVLLRGFRQFDPKRDEGTFSWFQRPHEDGPEFSEQFGKAQRRAEPGDYLMIWRHGLVCRNSEANLWEHFRMGFKLPDDPRFRPEVILLKPYAMWPLGEYRFDNLVLRTATPEEYQEYQTTGRHSIEGFMPLE